MNKTIISSLLLLLAFLPAFASGPYSFRGRVVDTGGRPIQYATVAITDSSGTVLSGATSAEDGTFEIAPSKAVALDESLSFMCSFIGYTDFRSAVAEMTAGKEDGVILLRDAVLEEDSYALSGAVVSGKREL
ncbi:MAG: carboxypeptidase-like regulatory domain-containing protein, partial [Bacteroidales bacterium]|nr:carboxypeptidase-like regulatory domain-containing protein [Bacteroidales bacterium]